MILFCRAEPYHSTPLCQFLAEEGRLSGSYLGYDYRIADDRVELLFRICAAAFRQRNFDHSGVHNRYMGLGYNQKLLEYFYGDSREAAAFAREVDQITQTIALQTADFLEEAIHLARTADLSQFEAVERETALLGLRVAAADRSHHPRIDDLYQRMDAYVQRVPIPVSPVPRSGLHRIARQVAQSVAVASWVAGLALGSVACEDSITMDPVPPDAGKENMVVDMVPPDAGKENMVVDMVPPDAGKENMVVDMVPPDAGVEGISTLEPKYHQQDPHADKALHAAHPSRSSGSGGGTWRDTSPRQAIRSQDLPFFDPPVVKLRAIRDGETIRITLEGGPEAISTRWEGDGEIVGQGREARWVPLVDLDQIRVGVRSRGGIAVISLRAVDVA